MPSIFSKHWRKEPVPKINRIHRPLDGKVLLTYFKDRYTLSHFCNALGVPFNTDITGYPLRSTTDALIEALIHQIIARDTSIRMLLKAMEEEMDHNKFPITSPEQWKEFKLLEPEEKYK